MESNESKFIMKPKVSVAKSRFLWQSIPATMKNVKFIFGLMVVGLGAGCFENSNSTLGNAETILYRHHVLGTASLAHNTNTVKLATLLSQPASRELGEQLAQKLSAAPVQLWRRFLPAGTSPQQALFRPLLDDLFSAESYAEIRGPLHRGESVFAIELPDQRASLWRTNLSSILTAWKLGKPGSLSSGETNGWELKRTEAPSLIRFIRSGKWVLIGLGQERLTLLSALLDQISKTGRPVAGKPNVPLDLEADLPRLGEWLPGVMPLKLPPIHLTITGRGDYLRTEARLVFSRPLPMVPEPWRVPTNLVGDPLISFTVARGIAPLLSQVKDISTLGLKPLPNQFCSWGPDTVHVDTFVTFPISNPSNTLFQIGPQMPDFFTRLLSQSIGGFTLVSNRYEIIWTGWPVLVPRLIAVRDRGADYLMGGLLPIRLATNRPPPELFSQFMGRTNVVYYDWEITQARLKHAKQLQQLWDIANHRRPTPTNAPAQKWLAAISPFLDNTITEATLTSPTELTFVRRSDIGLTGIELIALARWFASPGFPWKYEPPPVLSSRTNGPNSRTNPALPQFPAPPPKKQ